IMLVGNVARLFARSCIAGIQARPERCRQWIEESLALTTVLVPRLGYDAAAHLAQQAYEEGTTIRVVAQRETQLSAEELNQLLDAERMTHSGWEGGAKPVG